MIWMPFFCLLCLIACLTFFFRGYKFKKETSKQIRFDSTSPLQVSIAEALQEKGQVEVLAIIYGELYDLKKQLMIKRTIEPEIGYLLGEIYETYQEFDKKRATNDK